MKRLLSHLLSLSLALVFSVDAFAQETEVVYWGEARDDQGTLVYREKHITNYVDGKTKKSLTIYEDPTGREIATLESDYTLSLEMPTYVFKDLRRNYEEGLRFRDGDYYIFSKDSKHGEKEKRLNNPASVFSCQGWHYYVVENLERLERGDVFKIKLIFPNKLRAYDFKIEKVDSEGDTVRVKVKFANWLVSWAVPQLDLLYSKKERKLIDYRGVSNIFDENDDLQEVHITYSDDRPAD
ncbi:MAG: hypothetical protein ACWGSD_04270 [Thermodesulfobacteriota bacterium]